MSFAIFVDWREELSNSDRWENLGRAAIEEKCRHRSDSRSETNMRYSGYCDKCGFGEDSAQPMMNYAYPLEFGPSENAILEIVKETCCTVMHNQDTDEYFLTLCGGGMDLSQDIALAYVIAQKWLPLDLIQAVSRQYGLSQSGKNFAGLRETILEQLKLEIERFRETTKRWEQAGAALRG